MNTIELVPQRIISAAQILYELNRLAYHNWLHVLNVCFELDNWSETTGAKIGLDAALAGVGHDIVPYNEIQSASLFANILVENEINGAIVDQVSNLIAMTDEAQPPDNDNMIGRILRDADRAILGKDPGTYYWYAQAIRKEWPHATDEAFIAGRIKFLERMLGRTPIYRTDHFRDLYQAQAEKNMQDELATLQRP